MSCLIKNSNVYSPESTVSSLLASCSLNSSSDSNPFQYKDKLYRSASQALEAYIEDFDLSLASSNLRPGKISINQSTPKDFSSSKDSFSHKYGSFCTQEDGTSVDVLSEWPSFVNYWSHK